VFVKSPETKETRLILAPPDKSETSIYELNKSGQLSRLESRSTTAPVGTMLWRQRGWLALFSADKASVELTRFFGRNPQLHVVNVPPDTDNIDLEDITNDNKDDLLVFGKRTVGITVYRGTADGFSSKAISLLPEVSVSDMVITDLRFGLAVKQGSPLPWDRKRDFFRTGLRGTPW